MPRRKVLTAIGVACATVVALPAIGLTQGGGGGKPDLAVSAAAEPPDFEIAGGRFRIYLTISNQGRDDAGRSRARAFLSGDTRRNRGDIALGTRRIPGIAEKGQETRQLTARIPESTAAGPYFLIVCADTRRQVDESRESNNCHVSGQQVGIDFVPAVRGPAGPQGPAGPEGPRGDKGTEFNLVKVPRTTLQVGQPTVDDVSDEQDSDPGGGNDEGSSSTKDLVTVGPLTFRALCVQQPDSYESNPGTTNVDAKVLVIHHEGTIGIRGAVGARGNVVPVEQAVPGAEGRDGGEGKRMVVATEGQSSGGSSNFKAATGFVVHEGGTHVVLHGLYAGVGSAGANDDQCIFGGALRVVTP
jgi:hypothetical protein